MSLRSLSVGVGLALLVVMVPLALVHADDDCIYEGGPPAEGEHRVCQKVPGIKLIQPLDDDFDTRVPVDFTTPQATWMRYFMRGSEWLLEVCIGIVAIWILICGAAMILVGDANKTWRNKMFTSIVGLMALIFTVVILHFLNANFFPY